MRSLTASTCRLASVLACHTAAGRRTFLAPAMAFTVILQAVAFLALALGLLASLARSGQLNNFGHLLVLLCYYGIFAPDAGAVSRAHLPHFVTVAVFFQAVGFLALTTFALFHRGFLFPQVMFFAMFNFLYLRSLFWEWGQFLIVFIRAYALGLWLVLVHP